MPATPPLPNPNYYPSWTNCCNYPSTPWISQAQVINNMLVYLGVGAIAGAGAFAAFMLILAMGIEKSLVPGGGLFFLSACYAGIYYCNWWLNIRLICLKGNYQTNSALGAVYNVEPPDPTYGFWNLGSYDTDYSFNLLLYAATPTDILPSNFAAAYSPNPAPNPPVPWSWAPKNQLESQWSTLFPTVDWATGNMVLPQIDAMGALGLGFTGQYVQYPPPVNIASPYPTPPPSLPPLQTVTVTPTSPSAPSGTTVQFAATAIYAGQPNQYDVTSTITWSSSNTNLVTISSGGLAAATGQGTVTITALDQPSGVGNTATMTVTAALPPTEQMLLHCEIEGPGMYEFRALLIGLAAMFAAVAPILAIPVIGWALSLALAIFAFLALLFDGPAIQSDTATPPDSTANSKDGFGNYAFVDAPTPNDLVDILYVYGRWVFDSLHQPAGSNELHPVHFTIKVTAASQVDIQNGNWPAILVGLKAELDQQYNLILQPATLKLQAAPENQWSFHPLLDGCQGSASYAPPSTPPAPK
jgi:hypothetical protein